VVNALAVFAVDAAVFFQHFVVAHPQAIDSAA
jgi:hypothetical protein